MTTRAATPIAIVILVLACVRESAADDARPPPPPEAAQHVQAGIAAYDASDFETAGREFEAAYRIDPDPKWLYAWAQSRRLGGHCDEAVELYERYITTNPGDDNVAAASHGMSLCKQARATSPPAPPAPEQPRVAPREPPPAKPVTSAWYHDNLGTALVLGGSVTIGAGATFLVLAARSEDAAHRADLRDDFIARLDEATLRKRIGWACMATGAALAIAGVVRYATWHEASVSVAVTPRSIGVVGRF